MQTSSKRSVQRFGDFYASITKDLDSFCKALNFEPTFQQRELFDAVMRALHGTGSRKIAVRSGQGPGKTTASAVIGLYLLLLNPWTKLIITAPTMRQCKDVWLAEAEAIIKRADPNVARMFDFYGTSIGILGQKAKLWGCLLITSTKPENAQGQHRENMHLIVEEASGVQRELIEQFEGTLSNPNAIFLMIGNPNTRDCAFFDCFNSQRHKWGCYRWNAEETPASNWFDPQRNVDLADKYGIDSDVYRIRVLGEFPHSDPNCVMSSEDLEKCTSKTLFIPKSRIVCPSGHLARQFGLDFARFGGDESVIVRRLGYSIQEIKRFSRTDPNDVVDCAFRMQSSAHWSDKMTQYVADAGGMGQGVMANFHRANKRILEFHNNGRPSMADYENKITQGWFQLANLVKKTDCYIPNLSRLIQQLSTRQYYTTRKGRLVLETKDEYIKRGHDSPDIADAVVLAMWDEVIAHGNISRFGAGREVGKPIQTVRSRIARR